MKNKEKIEKLRKKGYTYQAIGDKLGVSRQRIYQLLYPDKHRTCYTAYRKTAKYKAYNKAYRKAYRKIHK